MDNSTRLTQIKKSLLGVISAITQTPSKNVQRARLASLIATAKVTGFATTASILGLVSTLGISGTGTAIGTLSGAASTSATFAWIGGLVGGGMATGALILPLTGIAAGATAAMYWRRKLHGPPRLLNEFHPFEDEILFSADYLIRPLDALLKEGAREPTSDELRLYAHNGLKPLIARIEYYLVEATPPTEHQEDAVKFDCTIKPKYQKQLRQHCRILQKHADVFAQPKRRSLSERFGLWWESLLSRWQPKDLRTYFTSHLASVVLVVTFQRLLSGQLSALEPENDLVLDALRRSTNKLEDASLEELAAYISGLSSEQLAGVASNTKGIYHELLFVDNYNASGEADYAQLMEETNFPGADVQFFLDGNIVREVQLKAINSPTLVYEHLERYPDIEILVTEETAAIVEGISSSGLSNAVLSRDVSNRLQDLQVGGLIEEVSDEILASAFVASGFVVWSALKTRDAKSVDYKEYLSNAGIAVGAATTIEGLFALAGS